MPTERRRGREDGESAERRRGPRAGTWPGGGRGREDGSRRSGDVDGGGMVAGMHVKFHHGSWTRASRLNCPARASPRSIVGACGAAFCHALKTFLNAPYYYASAGARFKASHTLKSSYFGCALDSGRVLEIL